MTGGTVPSWLLKLSKNINHGDREAQSRTRKHLPGVRKRHLMFTNNLFTVHRGERGLAIVSRKGHNGVPSRLAPCN